MAPKVRQPDSSGFVAPEVVAVAPAVAEVVTPIESLVEVTDELIVEEAKAVRKRRSNKDDNESEEAEEVTIVTEKASEDK